MTNANRQFTDRTEPQAAFRDAYLKMAAAQDPSKINSYIITYYGMGGIGKSRLLKQLRQNLSTDSNLVAKNHKKPLVVLFDFEGAPEGILILERLYKILHNTFKWTFPRFEWGLYFYKRTIGMDAEAPKVKPFVDEHDLNAPLNFIGKLPFLGPAVNFLKGADEAQAWLRNLYKPHEDLREKFNALTYKEQEEYLPRLFAENLNAYTEKSSTPLVFLLDTYEYITKHNQQGSTQGRDWWLHGEGSLISLSKNTLWVIAGRHKLQWEEEDDTIEQHMLGSLSEEDAASFLAGAGIPEDLIPGLYKLTTGTPIFLDVCVDLYEQLWKKNKKTPELSQFGLGDSYRLIECYLKYMDPRIKEMVYMLSYMPQWDKELVQSAAKEVLGEFHIAEFNQVKKLSITELKDESLYQIHGAVAEHLRNNPENELREDTARFLINHFLPVLDRASAYSEEYSRALKNVLYGGMLQYQDRKDRTKLADFYLSTMQEPQNRLCRCHRSEVAEDLFAPFWERAEEKPSDFLYASALYEKAWYTSQRISGRRSRSRKDDIFAWTIEALYLLQKLGKEDHILVPQALEAMAVNHTEPGFYGYRDFPMAFALHQYAIHLYKTKHPHDPIALINCRRNLAMTYQDAQDYDTAGALFRENLELAEQTLESGNRHRLQALQDLADFYHHHGDVEEALERSKQALKQKTAHLPEGDPDTIRSMIALADLYQKMSNLPEEAKVREQVLRFCRKHLPADHLDMDVAIRSLADTYQKLQAYSKELPLREELLERDRKECGDNSQFTLLRVRALAIVYHNLQWLDKRNALYVDWCRTLAKDHQMAWYGRNLLNSAVDDFQDHALVQQLCQILIQTDPQNSVYAKKTVADWYFDRGEFQKALDIVAEILENEPKDSDWIQNARFLQNRILVTMGREPDAWYKELVSSWHSDQTGRKLKPEMIHPMKDSANKSPISMDFTGLSLLEVLIKVCEKKSDARIRNLHRKLRVELPTSSTPSLSDLIAADPNWGDGPQIFTKHRLITEEDLQ